MNEFRFANVNDTDKILYFIKTLAEYENMADKVVCDEALLKRTIFEKKGAEVLFILDNGKEAGMALFFSNYSTFLGRSGLYIEDIIVLDEYRGKGYGKALFKRLAQIAKEREAKY